MVVPGLGFTASRRHEFTSFVLGVVQCRWTRPAADQVDLQLFESDIGTDTSLTEYQPPCKTQAEVVTVTSNIAALNF